MWRVMGGSFRREGICIYTYGWFMLRFDRKQQNSVKQLLFNKKISKFKKYIKQKNPKKVRCCIAISEPLSWNKISLIRRFVSQDVQPALSTGFLVFCLLYEMSKSEMILTVPFGRNDWGVVSRESSWCDEVVLALVRDTVWLTNSRLHREAGRSTGY